MTRTLSTTLLVNGVGKAELLERQAQREIRELERAKAVAGPDSENSDIGMLDQRHGT